MVQVMQGRFTAKRDEPFAVFIIGLRINRLLNLKSWVPTAMAMGPMLKELYTHPEKGFLGAEAFLSWRGVTMLQYWRSFEDLERFAKDPNDPHLPAWQRFNKEARKSGGVGVFHETYMIEPGNHETIYSNMPPFGLAKATETVPAVGARESARRRLMREERS